MTDTTFPPAGVAWRGVALLFLIYASSFVDRQILSLLVGPVRADLRISDTQISLLQGFAFALFYAMVGLPIGRWVDRGDRRVVLGLGVAAWSAFTMLCGRAQSFTALFVARTGVGIGEATVVPATYSLLADYFPAERRGLPLGVFGAGVYAGMGIAFLAGGLLLRAIATLAPVSAGPLAHLAPWRVAFVVAGAPGLVLAALAMWLVEPRRARTAAVLGAPAAPGRRPSKWVAPVRAIAGHHVAIAFLAMALYALVAWAPEYLRRRHGVAVAEAALALSLVVGVPGVVGVIATGILNDALRRRGIVTACLIVTGVAALCAAPAAYFFATASSAATAYGWLAVCVFFLSALTNCGPGGVQDIYPPTSRGVGSAILQFVVTLAGLGIGPTLVAMVGDLVFRDERRLGDALAVTAPAMAAAAAVAAFLTLPAYRRAVQRANAT